MQLSMCCACGVNKPNLLRKQQLANFPLLESVVILTCPKQNVNKETPFFCKFCMFFTRFIKKRTKALQQPAVCLHFLVFGLLKQPNFCYKTHPSSRKSLFKIVAQVKPQLIRQALNWFSANTEAFC